MDKNNSKYRNGYLYAIRLLSVTNRSAKELKKRLAEKGYETEIADQIINELEGQGILNDQKLVRDTVQWAIKGKRLGRVRIAFELKKRGIASETIEGALQNYSTGTERELAETLAFERWEKLKSVEPRQRRKRVYDFLIRRGFNFDLCRDIIAHFNKVDNDDENIGNS